MQGPVMAKVSENGTSYYGGQITGRNYPVDDSDLISFHGYIGRDHIHQHGHYDHGDAVV